MNVRMYVCRILVDHLIVHRSSSPCVFPVFAFSFLDLTVAAARLLFAIPICMYVCMHALLLMLVEADSNAHVLTLSMMDMATSACCLSCLDDDVRPRLIATYLYVCK